MDVQERIRWIQAVIERYEGPLLRPRADAGQ
jgi:hypothetical protein